MVAIKCSLNYALMYIVAFFIRQVVTLAVVVLNLFNNQTALVVEGFCF